VDPVVGTATHVEAYESPPSTHSLVESDRDTLVSSAGSDESFASRPDPTDVDDE
jgi:hypothetical protein